MRIHVWLAKHSGLSRRKAEAMVKEGRVQVNGEVATVGLAVGEDDRVFLDGKSQHAATVDRQLLALHKPVGYVCSQSPQDNQQSVFDLLPPLARGRWILVGRLDVNTSGLLLVTTDGQLANKLAHPSSGLLRSYLVRISVVLGPSSIRQLLDGVRLDDGMAKFTKIKPHGRSQGGINRWYAVTLNEGRNRIVRRLMASQGANVSRLMRVGFGPIQLEKALKIGQHQAIDCVWMDEYLKRSGRAK